MLVDLCHIYQRHFYNFFQIDVFKGFLLVYKIFERIKPLFNFLLHIVYQICYWKQTLADHLKYE